ncbi:MAG: isoprenylcysteine carboxyl methyltransferase family protein [bacterium]|jgi:methyltransferase
MRAEFLAFLVLLLALGVQRLNELRRSRINEESLRARGGFEVHPEHYPVMVALHASWFAAMLLEAHFRGGPLDLGTYWPVLGALALGFGLRRYSMSVLGDRWSTRIFIVPGEPPIRRGLYRYIRHPNYLGVVLELAAVPLLYQAWGTAVIWSIANLFLLRHRIRLEEQALSSYQAPESAARSEPY